MQLFLDLDGVLADFDAHHEEVFGTRPDKLADDVDWAAVRAVPNFFYDIPPTPDMQKLWRGVRHLDPVVLTGIPLNVPTAAAEKRAWVRRHLGAGVRVITCRSADKAKHGRPGDVLVDDWTKYRNRWLRMGGVFVEHVNAAESLRELTEVGVRVLRAGTPR